MKIYGDQQAVHEILKLISPSFKLPNECKCLGEHNPMFCRDLSKKLRGEDTDYITWYHYEHLEVDIDSKGNITKAVGGNFHSTDLKNGNIP